MARDERTSGPAAPDGLHMGVCVDVINLGERPTAFGVKHRVKVVWQLAEVNETTKQRYLVSRTYTLSLAPKATLRRDLESWRGKAFTAEELAGFNLLKLLGANCQLQTVATLSEAGATYANVQAVVPPVRTAPRLVAQDYVREVHRAQPRGNAPMGPGVNRVPF
jgi:hypothetical protein